MSMEGIVSFRLQNCFFEKKRTSTATQSHSLHLSKLSLHRNMTLNAPICMLIRFLLYKMQWFLAIPFSIEFAVYGMFFSYFVHYLTISTPKMEKWERVFALLPIMVIHNDRHFS